ncbi:hypothetical protein Btru_042913 [Bulinus truncatus]|nr:hypothetical protein Btru_042913 [Bulinus truncatus]
MYREGERGEDTPCSFTSGRNEEEMKRNPEKQNQKKREVKGHRGKVTGCSGSIAEVAAVYEPLSAVFEAGTRLWCAMLCKRHDTCRLAMFVIGDGTTKCTGFKFRTITDVTAVSNLNTSSTTTPDPITYSFNYTTPSTGNQSILVSAVTNQPPLDVYATGQQPATSAPSSEATVTVPTATTAWKLDSCQLYLMQGHGGCLATCHHHSSVHKGLFTSAGLQTSLLAAIASRESRSGYLIEATKGYGRGGQAYGIMQCDLKRSGLPCTSAPWNSCAHIDMMTGRALVPYIRQVVKKRPTWSPVRQLQGGCSAYNTYGDVNLNGVDYLDVGTTDGDYSNDVYARAQYYYSRGYR